MSEQKHTPGPWHAGSREVIADDETTICNLSGWKNESISNANANLIAAAPELLNACKRAYANMPEGPCANELREVIAKAEGKQ